MSAALFPPNADPADRALLARVADDPRGLDDWRELDADHLGRIAHHEGLDFATALLYDRLLRSPEHGPVIRRTWAPTRERSLRSPLAVVPGAFYREYPGTGADGRILLASVSPDQRVERVPVNSFGSVKENGETVHRWLAAQSPGSDWIVVTLSKGALDVGATLCRPDAAAAFGDGRVRAVVNVSGPLGGTALANHLRNRRFVSVWVELFLWRHGYSRQTLRELERYHPLRRVPVPWPELTFHVVGFPLARHLSTRRARRGYRRLSPLGPNDGGGILLGDVTRWPGTILPVWGADHYLTGVDVPGLIGAVLPTIVQRMISPS